MTADKKNAIAKLESLSSALAECGIESKVIDNTAHGVLSLNFFLKGETNTPLIPVYIRTDEIDDFKKFEHYALGRANF